MSIHKYIKTIYLVFLLLGSQFNGLFSQSYHKLVDKKKTWYVVEAIGGMGISFWTNTYKFGGDTIINGYNYTVLLLKFRNEGEYVGPYSFIREDTAQEKVYRLDDVDDEEFLIYDFNLEQGDTFSIEHLGCPIQLIVDSITTISIKDTPHKKIVFNPLEYWIEGIGSSVGILDVGYYQCGADHDFGLTCVYENDSLIFQTTDEYYCVQSNVGIEENNFENVAVYQNPLRIVINRSNTSNLSFQVFDLNGNLIESRNLNGDNEILLHEGLYISGLYILKLSGPRYRKVFKTVLVTQQK